MAPDPLEETTHAHFHTHNNEHRCKGERNGRMSRRRPPPLVPREFRARGHPLYTDKTTESKGRSNYICIPSGTIIDGDMELRIQPLYERIEVQAAWRRANAGGSRGLAAEVDL